MVICVGAPSLMLAQMFEGDPFVVPCTQARACGGGGGIVGVAVGPRVGVCVGVPRPITLVPLEPQASMVAAQAATSASVANTGRCR